MRFCEQIGALNEGIARHERGDVDGAAAIYARVLAACPDDPRALHLLGVSWLDRGDCSRAEALIRHALAALPSEAAFWNSLGTVLERKGRPCQAADAFRKAATLDDGLAAAWVNLGRLMIKGDDLPAAVAVFRKAAALTAGDTDTAVTLAALLIRQQNYAEAAAVLEAVLSQDGGHGAANWHLGRLRLKGGAPEAALVCFSRILEKDPGHTGARVNGAAALTRMGRDDEAISWLEQALTVDAGDVPAWTALGNARRYQGRFTDAIACFSRALALSPAAAGAWNDLGNALKDVGRIAEAVRAFGQALSLSPASTVAASNLMLTLNYLSEPQEVMTAAGLKAFGAIRADAPPCPPAAAQANSPLRIGYVSADFRDHAVSRFFLPLIAHHDRGRVHVTCYAQFASADETTRRIRALADRWVETVLLDDDALAERIAADRIDILVDLSGHTAGNRLPVFVRRPAPVQVSWLGYPGTTGLPEMDYRIVDALTDPPGRDDDGTAERRLRLAGGFLCYGPHGDAPAPGDLPALTRGQVTFGSFNHLAKVNDAVLDAWALILARLPGARILLKCYQFSDPECRRRVLRHFGQRGVDPGRVSLHGFLNDAARHLACYREVDIALDTFPYNGTTTTCEALWMGVPVVTLVGGFHRSRVGLSLLGRVGLAGLAAGSTGAYVDTAAALAADLPRLEALRRSLRQTMKASALCDGARLARELEDAFLSVSPRRQGAGGGGMPP